MKSPNRDLLVMLRDGRLSGEDLEHEVDQLNALLFQVESSDAFCQAHELIDLNRYKIQRKPQAILQVMRSRQLKPFHFLFNRN